MRPARPRHWFFWGGGVWGWRNVDKPKPIKSIFHGKNGPNSADFERKNKSKSPDFHIKFQKFAKNIEGFFFFFSIFIS